MMMLASGFKLIFAGVRGNGKAFAPSSGGNGGFARAVVSQAAGKTEIEGVADEEAFTRLLHTERKRSERTGESFALMIFDLSVLIREQGFDQLPKIVSAVRSRLRETDYLGWYCHPEFLGVLCTALGDTGRDAIRATLIGKAAQALLAALPAHAPKRVAITLHFFPEDAGDRQSLIPWDPALYPDVTRETAGKRGHQALKRSIDVVGSLAGLLLLGPLMLLIALLVKLTSPGPALFSQRRIGRFGREFSFLKFRTMHVGSSHHIHEQYVRSLIQTRGPAEPEVQGSQPLYKIASDPRVTPLGRILRKSSLDELPQLINVLRGEMSLVGPRPPIPYEVSVYRGWHRTRVLEAKPGITGLWQVCGRSRTTFDEMVRLDIRYIREQSIWMDLEILARTPVAVLSGKGAY